ncbi:MAG: TIGR02253 family HAD-type hydrolase [Candidatus Micrarchaeota archaeon]|nr:TIGR02253 family HAD-type hydrolase [Candidatus Micrarchaeota archaeon]
MIKAVVFDLDNTLMDFMKMKTVACREALSAMIDAGLEIDEKTGMKKLFSLYDEYGIEFHEAFQVFLKKEAGRIDWKVLASGINAYRRVKESFLSPYPHVKQTLIRLREDGLKLGIVSDAPKLKAWLRLTGIGLADFFDAVVTVDDAKGKRKPHPMGFQTIMKKLGVKADEVVFVGDNPSRDIKGANKVGMHTVLAKYGEWKKQGKGKDEKADYEIEDIKELLGLDIFKIK